MPRSRAYINVRATAFRQRLVKGDDEDVAAVLDERDDPLLAALLLAVLVDDRHLAGVAGGVGGVPLVHPAPVGAGRARSRAARCPWRAAGRRW